MKFNLLFISHSSSLLKPFIVVVEFFIVGEVVLAGALVDVDFDRIEPDDFQLRPALIAGYDVALLGIGIHVNFFIAFRANSGRHVFFSKNLL